MHPASHDATDRFRAKGWWEGVTLWDLFARNADREPERLALADAPNRVEFCVGEPVRWTYAQVRERADRLAAALVSEGVRQGDVVLVQLPNVAELVLTYLASSRIGAIVSPLPIQFRAHELRLTGALVEPVLAITTTNAAGIDHVELLDRVRAELPSIRTVLAIGEGPREGTRSLAEILETPGDVSGLDHRTAGTNASDVVTVCWTSGTEAEPKGVPRTHDLWTAIAYGTTDGAGLRDGDVLLTPFPLVNMSGIGGMLVPWLQTAGTLVLHQPMSLPVFLRQVVTERVNYTVAPPVLLNLLLADPTTLEGVDLSSLRTIGSGSAPLAPAMVEGWKERHGIEVVNFFGSNEGIALVGGPADIPDPRERARVFPRFGAEGLRWSNRVARGLRTKLVDPQTGEPVTELGRPGELLIAGPTVFAGYWRRDDLTTAAFDEEGFFRTGDLFRLEDEAHLRFVGRARDLIVRGGMKIAPEEVEALLADHPKIADVAVVGIADERMEGEQIVTAVVVPKEGETIELGEVRNHLRGRGVAGYKEPRRLVVVEALPRNALGKVLKREIRATVS
ncbi:MAG TPA: class I adenylate-forming enzyme family protein [Actinomycetota bacterium]|nr:class I adenylate-forming enzyme family protein [Actinomycetota bacterium]